MHFAMSPPLTMPFPPPYIVNTHHVLSNEVVAQPTVATTVSGILEKWVNCGKGWKPRWFVLQDGVLSYYKIHGPDKIIVSKDTRKGCRVIGSRFPHHGKPQGELHLKVSSFRESRSDDRRFSIFSGTQRLHLRANNQDDQVEWMESLRAVKRMFPRMSNKELLNPMSSEVIEKLRARLFQEGVNEEIVQDCERIMKAEFVEMKTQLACFRKKLRLLIDTLGIL